MFNLFINNIVTFFYFDGTQWNPLCNGQAFVICWSEFIPYNYYLQKLSESLKCVTQINFSLTCGTQIHANDDLHLLHLPFLGPFFYQNLKKCRTKV